MKDGSLHSAHVGRGGITPNQRAIIDHAGPDGFYLACGFFQRYSLFLKLRAVENSAARSRVPDRSRSVVWDQWV